MQTTPHDRKPPLLPQPLDGRYTLEWVIKDELHRKVLLLVDALDGEKYILKMASGSFAGQLKKEHEILTTLTSPTLPRPLQCFEWEGYVCSIRAYVAGDTLATYAENNEVSEGEAINIGLAACGIVEALHKLVPALVHRDLSATNFIRRQDGSLVLIDLDSVNQVSDVAQKDTLLLGTPGHAAPEQYGAQRSNTRTDVYGIGMLMVYLLTGDYDIKRLSRRRTGRALMRVLKRAVEFDPQRRYPSVAALGKALRACRNPAWGLAKAGAFLAVAVGLLALGLALLLSGPKQPALEDVVVFASPVVEAAVRHQLGNPQGELTYLQLLQVNDLFLMGDEPFSDWYAVNNHGKRNITIAPNGTQVEVNGTLSDLSDLEHMTNLTRLALYAQNVSDITVLSHLPLTHLVLVDNPVMDLSPLTSVPTLEFLNLEGTLVSDLSPLESLSALAELRIRDTQVRDVSPLAGTALTGLRLDARNFSARPEALGELTLLEWLILNDTAPYVLTSLSGLTNLRSLILFPFPESDLSGLPLLPMLGEITLHGTYLKTLEGLENNTSLSTVIINYNNNNDFDLSPLAKLPNLSEVQIHEAQLTNLSPLAECPRLRRIELRKDQKDLLPPLGAQVMLAFVD